MKAKKGVILHADDNEGHRRIVRMVLDQLSEDYDLTQLNSGKSLEDFLNNGIRDVRLIISDNKMPPGKTGLQLILDYASKEPFLYIPFILLHAGDREIDQAAIIGGAYCTLSKFPHPDYFSRRIMDALGYSQAHLDLFYEAVSRLTA